ncbi:MAG: hypothetical protein IT422_03055 [Pirellulaceae bacterium]|nr:hypothetical protein [Pirellulaceae bacterium]
MADNSTDDANYAFADDHVAKVTLRSFFRRCSWFVTTEMVADVRDIGFLARILEQVTVELGVNPTDCQDGFREARDGDWKPDEFFSESLGCLVKFREVWPPGDESELPTPTGQPAEVEAWDRCIERELAKLTDTADELESALDRATPNELTEA